MPSETARTTIMVHRDVRDRIEALKPFDSTTNNEIVKAALDAYERELEADDLETEVHPEVNA